MCSPYYVIRTLNSNVLSNLLDSVIHVIGAFKKQAPSTSFFLANFLPKTSRKRQYLFEFDMSDMLNNDSEITKIQVETQARKLLHELADSRQSSDQVGYHEHPSSHVHQCSRLANSLIFSSHVKDLPFSLRTTSAP